MLVEAIARSGAIEASIEQSANQPYGQIPVIKYRSAPLYNKKKILLQDMARSNRQKRIRKQTRKQLAAVEIQKRYKLHPAVQKARKAYKAGRREKGGIVDGQRHTSPSHERQSRHDANRPASSRHSSRHASAGSARPASREHPRQRSPASRRNQRNCGRHHASNHQSHSRRTSSTTHHQSSRRHAASHDDGILAMEVTIENDLHLNSKVRDIGRVMQKNEWRKQQQWERNKKVFANDYYGRFVQFQEAERGAGRVVKEATKRDHYSRRREEMSRRQEDETKQREKEVEAKTKEAEEKCRRRNERSNRREAETKGDRQKVESRLKELRRREKAVKDGEASNKKERARQRHVDNLLRQQGRLQKTKQRELDAGFAGIDGLRDKWNLALNGLAGGNDN